ncbi:MAG TPA: glutathione transferase GstA [Kofleriaceae bacterium]|nr:glutathione transferase GstA [Kofleriaceae bacterium]
MTYTLYYAPGTCSLSPSIAMREAGIAFDLVRVDLRAKKLANGDDYLAVNPKGYVPALRLPDGQILTEGAVMVQYIADQKPEAKLAPPAGTMARYRLMEWLNFIATELHKGASPLYNPIANDDFKKSLKDRLALRWSVLAAAVRAQPFVTGEHFTVADGYACYVLRSWQRALKEDLARWPELVDYYARLVARPTVAAALAGEGLEP